MIITPTVIKTANTSVVSIGNAVNYTITIENTDTSTTLTNITLTDALPTELSYVSNSLTVNSVPTTGSPITGISISNIAPSQTTTVRFSAIVTSKPASGTTYINSVAINYQFNSPAGTLSNTVNTTNTIYSSDVATTPNLTKTSNAVFADIGDTVTYTITFKNTSPLLTISTVTLKDTLPTGLSYKENSLIINGVPNSGSIVTGVTVTNIAPNETVTISFDALVTAAPTSNSKYINSINTNYTFVFPDGSNFTDTVSSTNNLYSPDVIVKPTLTLSVNKTEVSTGGTIDFTIIVSNPNTTTIENPILTDILQNGLSFITGTLEIDGTPSSNSLTTGISLPNMPQNSSHTITFSVKAISRPAPGTDYTNFATLTYSFQGPDGILNNTINSNIVTIVNTDVNINPIAFKDYSYKTYKNTSLKATLPIANLNNSPIIFTIVTPPANGFASIDQSKTFKYTPKVNFIGTDSFSVSLTNDTNGSSIFTINIVVSDFPSSLDSAIYCRK
ncbi:isopeptide-forming domain-containing fimbrial protein [Clostridium botulinum]|uniref:isopeptide-forming domain-containing fimbrial protein n=1 Tax=Clostridium botulinum TaxID=1491 RepID=UPI001177A476|nr:isopeptide-forming domain-containing fimbrial protein [Clostridium botulinum]